ncbi:uncharacterized protein ACJ7VT_003024 [Polymixia lowei]
MDSKPTKWIHGVCRLCGNNFISEKDRCNLLPSTGKPVFTVGLEEVTGPVSQEEDLATVCVSCQLLLSRYHTHICHVERLGGLIKGLAANAFTGEKMCASSTLKQELKTRDVFHRSSCTSPVHMDTVDRTKDKGPTPKLVPVLWSPLEVKAAVGKVPEKKASQVTVSPLPGSTARLTESTLPSPPPQSVQDTVDRTKDRDPTPKLVPVLWSPLEVKAAVGKASQVTVSPLPGSTARLTESTLPSPSPQSVQDTVDRTKDRDPTPKLVPVLWSPLEVKAAVGKASQVTVSPLPGSTARLMESTLPSPPATTPVIRPVRRTQTTQTSQKPTVRLMESTLPSPLTTPVIRPVRRTQTTVTVKTARSRKSRILTGPFQRVADIFVRGEHHRLPKVLMKIPGLDHLMIKEVLKRVKQEAIKLTSVTFGSMLRQTSPAALKTFRWTDVVSEWRKNAPTFLKFLECASSVSFDGLASSDSSYTKTKKCAMAMAGATLLRARAQAMNAPQCRNSLILRQGGATKCCFKKLSRLGICVPQRSTRKMLKGMGQTYDRTCLEWTETEGTLHEQSLTGEQQQIATGPRLGLHELTTSEPTSAESLLSPDSDPGDPEDGGHQAAVGKVPEKKASQVTVSPLPGSTARLTESTLPSPPPQSVQDTVDRTKDRDPTPKLVPVLWSPLEVKAAVGKASQVTVSPLPGPTARLMESTLPSPPATTPVIRPVRRTQTTM